ncbi:Metallo-dependent phosphatase-like protein [Mucor mucedo]|uniref:Metallo-dependent phosphatase-like protein n=1 Tax=Mucor mucedo TaxID=29922 RepID=UPI0022211B52|nr:Metallo-dependent phosphatase-like protein [Mucor mucedo]KAI7896607.1 Metallo-dependent phosphatase-like protein [Mucor mucedo]
MSSQGAEDNAFKILIATDNHIGYMEKDQIRGQDSFAAFEEILRIAVIQKVDFILLGGDLFHEAQPSQTSLYQTMMLIRQHCFGDGDIKLRIASDQSLNFGDFSKANYLDGNLNIKIPIFSIHGNHDDASGMEMCNPLNVLSAAGMVNYFGHGTSISDVTINPILLEKGISKLALYGLGNIREERLHRQWRSGKVTFTRPEDDGTFDSWKNCFNMFVLHQNRAAHGATSHIPAEFLDGFLDLVFWGHEHECRIYPEQYENFCITQPGSSVATSLSEGEAKPKHVGILTIEGGTYQLDKIRLKTVRPFQFTSVVLAQVDSLRPNDRESTEVYIEGIIEALIERAKNEWEEQQQEDSGIQPSMDMPKPLIRIRVDYTGGYETFNPLQFGRKFNERVANADDMLKFQKAKVVRRKPVLQTEMLNDLTLAVPERLDSVRIEDLVKELIKTDMFVLQETEIELAVTSCIEKNDSTSINRAVNKIISQAPGNFVNIPPDIDDLTLDYIKRKASELKQSQNSASANNPSSAPIMNDAVSPILSQQGDTNNDNNNNNNDEPSPLASSDDDYEETNTPVTTGRGRGQVRGRGRGQVRGRGRGAKRDASPDDPPSASSSQRRRLPF